MNKPPPTDTDFAEAEAEAEAITTTIMEHLGDVKPQVVYSVLCNLLGQLVVSLSRGTPSLVQAHSNTIADNIKKVAMTKLTQVSPLRRMVDKIMPAPSKFDA